jgi:hypothetical protein
MAVYIVKNICWKALSRVSCATNATLSSLTALIALSAHCWEAAKASSSNLLSWERWVLASLMSFLVAVSFLGSFFNLF